MLAGLMFATEEAAGVGSRLVATLPLAGATLVERQARQLVAAGAAHLVVVAPAPTPELAAAVHRIGRRGVAVDTVPGTGEAAATLHPLARLVMIADGLLAADDSVALLAGEGGDALLVVPGALAPAAFERIGGGGAWAGVARLGACRLAEAAALPRDYDPQSTLLRAIEAAGPTRIDLSPRTLDEGHGIERDAAALERRGRRLMANAVAARHGWFDRGIAAPLSRAALPLLAQTAGATVAAAVLIAAALGMAALIAGWPRTGLALALAATIGCVPAATLATIRGEELAAAALRGAGVAVPLLAMPMFGRVASLTRGDPLPLAVALALAVAALLGERAMRVRHGWWGSPPGYLLLVAAAALVGAGGAGLLLALGYAVATLAAAIEALRASDA